ncbi:DinB family protein [Streptomyces sp. NPDC055051]|uniref:DinB family protein n=1 Tax=Streptomyces sp. NPDC014861 TaxID=3364923 RepID=UPI0036FD107C
MTTDRTEAPERVWPDPTAGERQALEQWLEFHRATLAMKCADLTEEQLRTVSVPPSALSLLGLVRHMAEVERGWFRKILGGEEVPWLYADAEDFDRDIRFSDRDTYEDAYAVWQAEIAHARSLAADRALDDLGAAAHRRSGDFVNLRFVYLHMIEEYARHNGHADLIRERIDGATGD